MAGEGHEGLVPDQAAASSAATSTMSRRSTASTSRCAPARRSAWSANPAPARRRSAWRSLRLISSTGRDRLRRPRHRPAVASARCGRCARDMQIVFQDPFGSLSPRMSIADIIAGRAEDPRAAAVARPSATQRVAAALSEVGLDPATPQPLSARIFRRPAPAHRDRPRHGARTQASSCSTSRPRRST